MDYGYDYSGQYVNQQFSQGVDEYGQPYQQQYNQGYDQTYPQQYNQGYDPSYQQQYDQNLYGEQMLDGRRFSGYTMAQIKQGLREYVMNCYGKPIRREVTMETYPMPDDNVQSNYGNMRHACATRGVCYLAPSIFYIPSMQLEVVYYYCEDCNTLYYSKAQTNLEAQERRNTMRMNNALIKQQEREEMRMMREYNRDLVRNYKAMEREQNRMWREQIRMCNRKY